MGIVDYLGELSVIIRVLIGGRQVGLSQRKEWDDGRRGGNDDEPEGGEKGHEPGIRRL